MWHVVKWVEGYSEPNKEHYKDMLKVSPGQGKIRQRWLGDWVGIRLGWCSVIIWDGAKLKLAWSVS